MDAWNDHIQAALGEQSGSSDLQADVDDLALDPELHAHFTRAHEILDQIGRKAPRVNLVDQIRINSGFAILIRPNGKVVAHSAAANEALNGQGDLDVLRSHLTANSSVLLDNLCQAVQAGQHHAPPVVLSTGSVPRHLMARGVGFASGPDDGSDPVILLEALEYQWSAQAEAMLVTSFGLSRAELDIVRNLLAGQSLREMAESSGRSEHTVRNQAKAVLAKTGAPGQVDLIRLVVYLINHDTGDATEKPRDTAAPDAVMNMASGLGMQVFRFGPQDGQPVIFLHGMLDGLAPLKYLERQLSQRGLYVIAPVRPGFGRSSPVKRADQALDVFVGHVNELISSLGPVKPVILGHMAGAVYAHAIAAKLKDQIAGVVAVSGGAPITRTSQLSEMAPRQRVVAYTARFAPALLPTVLRAGIAQIDSKDIQGFMTALYKPGTQEYHVIRRLDLAQFIQSGYRFSVQQGAAGFATDSHFVVRDWGIQTHGPTAPVVYVQGALDPVVPAQSVVDAMAPLPDVDVRVLDDVGQLVFYECPDIVFDAIEELADTKANIAASAV